MNVEGAGTREDPWILTTPPGTSEFEAYRDPELDPPALVVQVGATHLRYHLRCVDDLHAMRGRRVVRPDEGPARTVGELRHAGARGAGGGGGRAPGPRQADAGDLAFGAGSLPTPV